MPFYKEKTLPNGVTGNHWAASDIHIRRRGVKIFVDFILSLYKDSTPGLEPLGYSHKFSFEITQQELVGNIVQLSHQKILAEINHLYTPISGVGDPVSRYPDLVGATIVL